MQLQQKRFNARLCCNFDQVWSMAFRPKRRVLMYRGEKDALTRFPAKKKLRHLFERCLSGRYTDSFDVEDVEPADPTVSGGLTACCPPDGFRNPHTLTTLSWADGTVGRGFVTVRDDAFGEKQRQSINKDCISRFLFQIG